ncbi:DUF3341 domain-containing protein [Cytophagales bacterium LB-30]|uniref:DUF3341 domain-containing protein n=1 Tax=Shiella aurantiaca TaxID=3058365 RepID=A0ABT8F3Y2_9BACT|nr:DUF3341 domain-containing protein [Shiella aurantiaca]MDN4165160.1 DUF3341 domain-containing protein [Shiella aurantiaca]
MEYGKKYILGVFNDEDVLLHGTEKIREAGVKIEEVYSPFPVHGLDDALGYQRSRLPIAAFLFGATGTILGLTMIFWMMGVDWPMIIGGKDFIALPIAIPITFELTVLLSALGMVGTFLIVSDLKPWGTPRILDIRSTDDKHIMAIDIARNSLSKEQIGEILKSHGAVEVNEKSID